MLPPAFFEPVVTAQKQILQIPQEGGRMPCRRALMKVLNCVLSLVYLTDWLRLAKPAEPMEMYKPALTFKYRLCQLNNVSVKALIIFLVLSGSLLLSFWQK